MTTFPPTSFPCKGLIPVRGSCPYRFADSPFPWAGPAETAK